MNLFITMLFTLTFLSCAGPTSPFGKIEPNLIKSLSQKDKNFRKIALVIDQSSIDKIQITLSPQRQLIHDKSKLKISILDPNGFSPDYKIKVFYDHFDVTESFLSNSKKSLSQNKKSMIFTLDNFRMIPAKENKIIIAYRRNSISPIVYTEYKKPTCRLRVDHKIGNISPFNSNKETIKTLEQIAFNEKINPNFLAGLVAQESGFNSRAVSSSKAIGLTQVTPIAEKQLLKNHPDWPRYEKANHIPIILLKSLIKIGTINAQNEWRLNTQYSLQGGVEFLSYIEQYWKKEENEWLIQKFFGQDKNILNDIILASYNSGPYRVKQSIRKKGLEWRQASFLKEANIYIKKVNSYCYHFANSET